MENIAPDLPKVLSIMEIYWIQILVYLFEVLSLLVP